MLVLTAAAMLKLADAKRNAYEAVSRIHFQGAFYRSDIADKALLPRESLAVAESR